MLFCRGQKNFGGKRQGGEGGRKLRTAVCEKKMRLRGSAAMSLRAIVAASRFASLPRPFAIPGTAFISSARRFSNSEKRRVVSHATSGDGEEGTAAAISWTARRLYSHSNTTQSLQPSFGTRRGRGELAHVPREQVYPDTRGFPEQGGGAGVPDRDWVAAAAGTRCDTR